MIPKIKKPIKGMAFAGCSFTWGQNLWYYSNLPTVIVQEYNSYNPQYVSFSHRAFAEANRYPRLVANHFKAFELCQPFNGGSNSTILDNWQKYVFDESSPEESYRITSRFQRGPKYKLSDIDTFVLQFTHWSRTDITFDLHGKTYGPMQRWALFSDNEPLFFEYLDQIGMSVDRYFRESKQHDICMIKEFLLDLQKKGIRVYVLCWPKDLVEHIEADKWLAERFIKIQYKDKEFTSIATLVDQHPEMCISGDTEYFEVPPKDDHPSLKCHRVIADSIIRHIENENEQWTNQYLHPTKTA